MNTFAQAICSQQSNSTRMIRAMRLVTGLQNQASTELWKRPRHRGEFLGRLGFLSACLAMSCGVAQAQSLVATVPSGPNPAAVAVNQTTNMVYVADVDIKTLLAIDGATSAPTAIQAGGPLAGVAVNPTTNTIYALNGGGSVAVINGATNAVTATIALPEQASCIAANPVTNRIYVCTHSPVGNGATGNVAVIDGSTNSITATVSMPALISHIGVDTVRNVIYVMYTTGDGNFNPTNLAAIDGATNTVTATVVLGINGVVFALNETTNTIYSPDTHFNHLYVIDGATLAITANIAWPDTLDYGLGLAINPVTNTIYVPAYNSNSQVVDVMDGSSNTITASISTPTTGGVALLVNSVTNEIWQVSNPVAVIDGATNTVTSVTGTSNVLYGALNTATNYAYMAGINNVFVISGAPAGPAFSASPNPLAFGNQTQGTTSSAKTLTVTNTGTSDLTITTVTAGGTNLSDFIIESDTCSNATVAAGKTCTVSVEFDPSTPASESVTLTFADNASDSPQKVTLTGTGVAPVPTPTTTKLSASATSVAVGTSVTLTATVTPASGTPTPTGTVTFKDGATTLGTGTLNGSGVATYSTSSLAIASHSIAASYGGDARNIGSTSSTVTVIVTVGSTTTALTASAASIAVGSTVTFTAAVTGASGVPTPTGTVTFMNGATTLGTGTLNGSGMATYSASTLAAGSYSVTAVYKGDTNNASSTSSAVAVVVWPGPPAFTLTLGPASGSVSSGKDAVTTITVTSVNGFNAATSLACGNLPKDTTCAFSSSNITPTVSGKTTSTLTIATDVKPTSSIRGPEVSRMTHSRSSRQGPIEIASALAGLLLVPLLAAKRRKLRRLLLTISSVILFATLASIGMTGCGGSGATTPNGTYSIQVTATSGSLTQSATYSLTVQ